MTNVLTGAGDPYYVYRPLLDLTGLAEGTDKGRGYNETLAYGRLTDGPVALVGMTLTQIDALQTRMLQHNQNVWSSSAAGRYQIVRTTLRSIRKTLGLTGSEKFDADMQDRLALLPSRPARYRQVSGRPPERRHADAQSFQETGQPADAAGWRLLQRPALGSYPIGYFHIDIAEVQTAEGKLYLFVAIDRTSKFAKMNAAQFLRNLIAAVPYTIHTVLTDNGIQFTNQARHKYAFHHIFDRVCDENGIEHRLTRIKHPWTNRQVERMNRTIKDATVKRFHYDDHDQLRRHLADFINAYNFGRRLKTLKGLTPYEFIRKRWTSEPDRFTIDPIHQMPGLNN